MKVSALLCAAIAAAPLFSSCAAPTRCSPLTRAPASGGRVAYQAEARDRTCLQAFEWAPAVSPARGAVVIIHGIRDHASRYSELAERLSAQGFAVYAQDLRGHGRSGGSAQRFDDIQQLVADASLAVQQARRRHPGAPVFLYGHSLGGLIATHYALAHADQLSGVVLSGAALKLQPSVSGFEKAAARVFGALLPGLHVQHVDDRDFVRTPEAKKELAEDPLIDHSKLPARSATAALDAIDAVQRRMEEVAVPLLILHGLNDKATNVDGSRELAARARSKDKTLKLYEGVSHDLLHEPERGVIISEVEAWLAARLPARSAQVVEKGR